MPYSIGREFTPEENAWNSSNTTGYDATRAMLSAANGGGARGGGRMKSSAPETQGMTFFPPLQRYLSENELANYLNFIGRDNAEDSEGGPGNAKSEYDSRSSIQNGTQYPRQQIMRRSNGQPAPAFAGTAMPGGQSQWQPPQNYLRQMLRGWPA